jgi:hypothetical protein
MKLIYKTISGLILSIVATLAIAALVSFSNLVKPAENQQAVKVNTKHTQIKTTHKDGICHQYKKADKPSEEFSFCR